jgi:uncharacterized protein (TIGR02594 family)
MLPSRYGWLAREPGPKMIVEALKLYGTLETPGSVNNPTIIAWAKEVGGEVEDIYKADSIPWCGLFMAVVAKRAGKEIPKHPLWALSWSAFGAKVPDAALGDVLVFVRNGGGHVGLYVGEDASAFHVLGGNQSDRVCIRCCFMPVTERSDFATGKMLFSSASAQAETGRKRRRQGAVTFRLFSDACWRGSDRELTQAADATIFSNSAIPRPS